MNSENIKKYLLHIDVLQESINPNKNNLYLLQEKHLMAIPFENLDIHYKVPIKLDIDKIYEKIITRGRGGFCYELNGLFASLLEAVGYNVKLLSCRVFNEKEKIFSPEYDHMAILIEIENERYIMDVGFGDFSLSPISLETKSNKEKSYFIDHFKDGYYQIYEIKNKCKIPSYIFKKDHFSLLKDFEERCNWHQNNDESHFSKKKVITKLLSESHRVTLTDTHFIHTYGTKVEKEAIEENEFELYLKRHFDININ